ncbi:type II toxin-antitoxin system RelE/ParE family toxin [Uliginosibacterium sp. sgz301328]|uniref:type II toxin-antitoxin system RelE/ParE family toxin n=1 Tax=Uliginosibacterium sp. sgz301328 TaxID=3243764 RepID=UPI00359EAAD3
MNTINQTSEFSTWLRELKDLAARAAIITRVQRAEAGTFGDCEPVGEGVSEMRIHVGAGYRVYFVQRGKRIYLLLCGGDKSSQKRDIKRAKEMARNIEE